MPTKSPRTRRASLVFWVGVVGMMIAGFGVGVVLSFLIALPLFLGTEMSAISITAVFSLVTLFPAVALWLTRNGYCRGLAVGLAAVWLWLASDLFVSDGEENVYGTGVAEISERRSSPNSLGRLTPIEFETIMTAPATQAA